MTGEEYTAFLRARKPEVYVQNSSGVPVKWIVTRAYINGVSAKRHTDAENYRHNDTGFFPVAMLMTKAQAEKRMENEERPILVCPVCGKKFQQKHCERICSDECRAKKAKEAGKKIKAVRQQLNKEREEILGGEIELAKKIKRGKVCAGCGAIFRAKGGERYCKTCMKKGVRWGIE